MLFAKERHGDQKRKYNGQPYWMHLAEVAGLVSSATRDDISLATAWLHDTVEDTDTHIDEIRDFFGADVAHGVWLLTDPTLEFDNRAKRVAHQAERLASAPGWVQTVKFADMISNTADITVYDPAFGALYLKEKKLAWDGMLLGDPQLRTLAGAQIIQAG
jgi:guanosine-3',5'-bis(diphosphate) 3'-pyrophosphohydrolase